MTSDGPAAASSKERGGPHLDGARASSVLVGSVVVTIVAYLWAVGPTLRPLGPDAFGYIWQTRLVGHAPLTAIGTRPGFPVLASMVSGVGIASSSAAALITPVVLLVALGFAVGAVVRVAFGLPRWAVCSIGVTVALWGGAVHLSQGHLANELSLVCIMPAVFLLGTGERASPRAVSGSLAAATASGFAHPGILPFYLAVAALWAVFSLLFASGTARRGSGLLRPSRTFLLVLVGGGLIVAVVLGSMGYGIDDITNLTERVQAFTSRLDLVVRSIGLWVSAVTVLAVAGVVVVARSRRGGPRALVMLGSAWVLVSAAGGLLGWWFPSLPGHRALGMIVPLPALAGLGVVGAVEALGSDRIPPWLRTRARVDGVGPWVAVCVVVASCVAVAIAGLAPLSGRADLPANPDPARVVGAYIAAAMPEAPIVLFTEPTTATAALSWRGRQNRVRALAPLAFVDRVFVVVGAIGPDDLPVRRAPDGDIGDQAIEVAIDGSWEAGGEAAVRTGGVVVAAREYVGDRAWRRLSADPSRVVAPGLAVIRGPLVRPAALAPAAGVPVVSAGTRAILGLILLASAGGGFAAWLVRDRGRPLDAAALAPAAGAVVFVLTGVSVGLLGIDPSGADGLLAAGAVSAVGYVCAARSASASRTRSTSSSE